MMRRANRRGLRGAWAIVARLLVLAYLFASFTAPHLVEAASPNHERAGFLVTFVSADQDSKPSTASRPHGMIHAGSHCTCQLADRLAPATWVKPVARLVAVPPALTSSAYTSQKAEPPARPPRI